MSSSESGLTSVVVVLLVLSLLLASPSELEEDEDYDEGEEVVAMVANVAVFQTIF